GWRKAAQLPQPFDSMIGSLAVGDVTEPVRTPGGFIILKLEEKRGGSKMVRDEVHVRHILLKPSEIRSEAETEKLAQKLYERIQVSEQEVKNFLGWRKAAQLPQPFDSMIGSLAVGDVTEPVRTPGGFIILKLEEKRGGSKMVRDEVHVRHILLKPSEIRSEAETEKLAQKLYERIQSGEDFGELAKSFSEDPGSALNGGDLNWIDPEALVPEFRQVMNDTPQGELSKPFRSQFGWHILQVLGRRATDSSEKFREQQAVSVLRNRKYDEELQAWLRQIRDEAYVEIKQ
uniref:peptidylprolyl isomerase n=1 Tax=Pseudomonas aeruginosa TaxID=287 RepID=UPI0021C87CE2